MCTDPAPRLRRASRTRNSNSTGAPRRRSDSAGPLGVIYPASRLLQFGAHTLVPLSPLRHRATYQPARIRTIRTSTFRLADRPPPRRKPTPSIPDGRHSGEHAFAFEISPGPVRIYSGNSIAGSSCAHRRYRASGPTSFSLPTPLSISTWATSKFGPSPRPGDKAGAHRHRGRKFFTRPG